MGKKEGLWQLSEIVSADYDLLEAEIDRKHQVKCRVKIRVTQSSKGSSEGVHPFNARAESRKIELHLFDRFGIHIRHT